MTTWKSGHRVGLAALSPQAQVAWIEGRVDDLQKRITQLEASLRAAPMPPRESVLRDEDWDEFYGDWWHDHASEKALAQGQ